MVRDQLFISYSHKDKRWLERLRIALKPLINAGLDVWDDTRIKPGALWREEIRAALSRTKIAILLVSPHFLASDFVMSEELPSLFDAAGRDGAIVVWIPVSASLFGATKIATYQAISDPDRPLDKLRRHAEINEHMVRIASAIKELFADGERDVTPAVVPVCDTAGDGSPRQESRFIVDSVAVATPMNQRPIDDGQLAQGYDIFALPARIDVDGSRKDIVLKLSWDFLFGFLGASLFGGGYEAGIHLHFRNDLADVLPPEYVRDFPEGRGQTLWISDAVIQQIEVQFMALGLIEPYKEDHWRLTERGRSYLLRVKSIRK